ncbi:MAG: hypothetical protein AB7T06_01305 [Kofleriaceae bacterium]
MRALIAVASVLGLAAWTPPERGGIKPDDLDKYAISTAQLERYMAPYLPAVRACYARHAPLRARGELALHLVISEGGGVIGVGVEAPGVTGRRLARLTTCIQNDARRWHFPVRAGRTVALVPFSFQRLVVPNAGPMPGCFERRGCIEKRAR